MLLRFLDFDLEHEPICEYDYLQVFDGEADTDSAYWGKFCGQQVGYLFYQTLKKPADPEFFDTL